MNHQIEPIHGANLSDAWVKTFVKCWEASGGVIAPAIVYFDVNEDDKRQEIETDWIRGKLEEQLYEFEIRSVNQSNIETVAGTIFPESIWKRCQGKRQNLFDEYDKMWPFVKKCKENRYGTYFRRLTAFDDPKNDKPVNQLETIITTWKNNNHRKSALQAGIFDPTQDHRPTPYLGFPCLQQVVFHPHGSNGKDGMTLVALYANQLLLEKAYGNYLGLYRLGRFMAGEMGLKLRGVTCIATNLKLSREFSKTKLAPLKEAMEKELLDEI